jgi:hypothetical protein
MHNGAIKHQRRSDPVRSGGTRPLADAHRLTVRRAAAVFALDFSTSEECAKQRKSFLSRSRCAAAI